jgi:hypothetical protein
MHWRTDVFPLSFSEAPRKRKRASSPNGDTSRSSYSVIDSDNKPRRVDPERKFKIPFFVRPFTYLHQLKGLAQRLDPALVEEMESYIVPGAMMPSYEIRKDLQDRYSVDRRPIYDYFHSRGNFHCLWILCCAHTPIRPKSRQRGKV